MRRLLLLALLSVLLIPATSSGGPPPHSNAFGKSLSEWMEIWFTRAIAGDPNDRVGKVQLMPLPAGVPVMGSGTLDDPLILKGQLDVTLSPGVAFVMPVTAWTGETYLPDSGIPDDPVLDASVFTDADVLVQMDGRTIIDSELGDLEAFYFGPIPFDPPLLYAEPTDYGAIGATYVQGIGFAHQPLSRGTHTMTLMSEIRIPEYDLHVIFMNEWTITVTK